MRPVSPITAFFLVIACNSDTIELSALESAEGDGFLGFEGEGTWMLGLLGEASFYRRPYFLGEIED